jgi:SAM-dependent methyltransferase
VKAYWEAHVGDWPVATHAVGTSGFFREIEAYRFDKLHYLPKRVDFAAYPGERVLDVGCGVGNDLSRFAVGGARVVGIDIAERAIELAQANFDQRGLCGDLRVMDGGDMEFPDDSFDVVYCHTVLHFTAQPERVVQEIHRVLKPDGVAILMTINRRSWLHFLHRAMRVKIDHLGAPVYRRHSPREFGRLLAPFANAVVTAERYPVATRVHSGLKARLFNGLFVGAFRAVPRRWLGWSGHHLLAYAWKTTAGEAAHPCVGS